MGPEVFDSGGVQSCRSGMMSVLKFLTPAQTSEMLQWLSMTG